MAIFRNFKVFKIIMDIHLQICKDGIFWGMDHRITNRWQIGSRFVYCTHTVFFFIMRAETTLFCILFCKSNYNYLPNISVKAWNSFVEDKPGRKTQPSHVGELLYYPKLPKQTSLWSQHHPRNRLTWQVPGLMCVWDLETSNNDVFFGNMCFHQLMEIWLYDIENNEYMLIYIYIYRASL